MIDVQTFNDMREVIYNNCGISLNDSKKMLVAARISKRMRLLGMNRPREYYDHVMKDRSGMELVILMDSIATNVTSFFRGPAQFDFFREKISAWAKKGQKKFRIWSAGCSTGEEPYSIAFALKEAAGNMPSELKILATDISATALGKAKQAIYPEARVKSEIPLKYIKEHMSLIKGTNKKNFYSIKNTIRELVMIKRLNLSAIPFPMKGNMDFIFCRNVMIYFDNAFKEKLVNEFYRLLKPGGYLMLGNTESLIGFKTHFKRAVNSIHIKDAGA